MAAENCAQCSWRARHDDNPKSFLGRLWRWHINFCPGWKDYFTSLPDDEKTKLGRQYNFSKYQ